MINQYHKDFFIVLGYLAAPARITKLDIETHPNNKITVESRYKSLAGEQLVEDDVNYYVWDPSVNKWGSELRIYFRKNSNIHADLQSMVVSPRFAGNKYNARINSNDFVWLLIKYGFRASNSQDENLIRTKIPSVRIGEFDLGYNS